MVKMRKMKNNKMTTRTLDSRGLTSLNLYLKYNNKKFFTDENLSKIWDIVTYFINDTYFNDLNIHKKLREILDLYKLYTLTNNELFQSERRTHFANTVIISEIDDIVEEAIDLELYETAHNLSKLKKLLMEIG